MKASVTHEIGLPIEEVIQELSLVVRNCQPAFDAIRLAAIEQETTEVDFTLDMSRLDSSALIDELSLRMKEGSIDMATILEELNDNLREE